MKTYNVNLNKNGQLKITGKGDDPLWKKAEVLTDFISAWDKEPVKRIEFKALWDTENLFFSFKVYDREVHVDGKEGSFDSIENSDRVELFLEQMPI